LLRASCHTRALGAAAGRGGIHGFGVSRRRADHRRRTVALARAAGVRLVSGTERVAAADLRPGDGRVPRRPARRPGQRQSRSGVDALVPARAVRDAFDRSHRCHSTTERADVVVMTAAHYESLLIRHSGNPILRATDWPYPAHTVFNAGATLLPDGTTLLLCRVEDRRGHSHLCAGRSANGSDVCDVV